MNDESGFDKLCNEKVEAKILGLSITSQVPVS